MEGPNQALLELTKLDGPSSGARRLRAHPVTFKVVKLLGSERSPDRAQLTVATLEKALVSPASA